MIYVTGTIIPAGTICVLFALITSVVLGFAGVSDAQEVTGYVIQTFDDLCIDAFLNNFAKSHTIIDKLADTSGDIKSIVIHLPSDTSGSVLSALLEPADGFTSVSIDITNDTMTLTPIAEGQDYVEMTVSDGKGGYDHGYFRVCTVVSNSPPRLSSIPEHIPISIEAETVNMSITATDTDNDKIFWFSVLSSNRSVASAQYDYTPSSPVVGQYHHVSPCELRYGGERSQPLLIIPNGIGNSTLTIKIADIWGGTDTKVLHVTVYGPTDVN